MAEFLAWLEPRRGQREETEFEVPDEELEGLTETERDAVIARHFREALTDLCDLGWTEIAS